jgi:hypothetical protein
MNRWYRFRFAACFLTQPTVYISCPYISMQTVISKGETEWLPEYRWQVVGMSGRQAWWEWGWGGVVPRQTGGEKSVFTVFLTWPYTRRLLQIIPIKQKICPRSSSVWKF